MYLNGTYLPAKTGNVEQDVLRSVIVGLKVHQAKEAYDAIPNKVSLEQQIEFLQNITKQPVVSDVVKANLNMLAQQMPMTSSQVALKTVAPKPKKEEEVIAIA